MALSFGWPFGGRERRSVDLTPEEQIALRELLRLGEATEATLRMTMESVRGVARDASADPLRDLQAKELIVLARVDGVGATYRPTKLGRRLRDRLSPEPRSIVGFRL